MGAEGDLGFFAMRAAAGRLSALWCGGLLEVDTPRNWARRVIWAFLPHAATGRLSALWCRGLLEVDTSRSGAEGDLGFLAWVEVWDFPAF